MIVFRLTHEEYAEQLQASGAPNRWNKAGQYVIYASGSISLCALELLAHTNGIRPQGTFKVMHIEVDPLPDVYFIEPKILPEDWQLLSAYPKTQSIGSEWYDQMDHLVMRIPSAIIPTEWNYMINTRHPDFSKNIRLVEVQDFFWDSRFPEY